MRRLPLLAAALAMTTAGVAVGQHTPGTTKALTAATRAPTRDADSIARDRYRHPIQTLGFFGVKPSDTVVEIWPGGGWYTQILAPYLATSGTLYAVGPSEKSLAAVKAKQAASPAAYRTTRYAMFPTDDAAAGVPKGTADVVLTFRNVHNWRFGASDQTQSAFDQMYAMLKPGGTLGVVEHRLPEDAKGIEEAKSGYMKRSSVIAFAKKAGFRFVGESKVNANPRDTHDYPKGVWTLPPTFTNGNEDRAKYSAIGESDRMTLRFVKPR